MGKEGKNQNKSWTVTPLKYVTVITLGLMDIRRKRRAYRLTSSILLPYLLLHSSPFKTRSLKPSPYLSPLTYCMFHCCKDPNLCSSLLHFLASHQEHWRHALIYLYTSRHCHLRHIFSHDSHASCCGSFSAELNQKHRQGHWLHSFRCSREQQRNLKS